MKVIRIYSKGLRKILNGEINNIPQEYPTSYIGETVALMDSISSMVMATVKLTDNKRESYYGFAEFYDIDPNDFDIEERYIDSKLYTWYFDELKLVEPPIKLEVGRDAYVFDRDIESELEKRNK